MIECLRVETDVAQPANELLPAGVAAHQNDHVRLVVLGPSQLAAAALAPVALFPLQELQLGGVGRVDGRQPPRLQRPLAVQETGAQHLEGVLHLVGTAEEVAGIAHPRQRP